MEFLVDGIRYQAIGNEVKVVGLTKKATSVIIPSEITYKERIYRVTSIGDWAFSDCRFLREIRIPRGTRAKFEERLGDDFKNKLVEVD